MTKRKANGRKQFRTKFTQHQRERMFEFAERVGWKLQKQDEELISEFCSKIGVKKRGFKVWLHNKKKNSTLANRDQPTADILPECIIHKILCYLSYREASRMRILSKTWRQAWLTHPHLKFRFRSSDEDIKIVDKIMERYRDGKIPIERIEFKKSLYFVSHEREFFPLIDKWIGIALQNGVKDLVYRDTILSSCPFPIFKFLAAMSLRELVLTDLRHLSLSTSHVMNCHSLRKLSLSRVFLDDNMLQTLLTSCPLIVNLIIIHCHSLKKIELRNLQKIRSLTIKINSDQIAKIQAPTLEHLSYSGDYLQQLDIVEYKNLKSLEILSFKGIFYGFIKKLFSRPHFLESLTLDSLASGWLDICSSQSLRFLKIKKSVKIGVIDAPNLVSLEYEGDRIPQLKFAKERSQLKNSHIILDCWYNLDAVWFCRLREFLSNSTSWSKVSLVFSECNEINRKDLQLHHRIATPQVEVFDVNIKSSGDCPTFVDALLWSCHPRRLNLSSTVKTMICFIDQLVYMKNSSHSISRGSKPWLSQLKEVKAYKFNSKNQSWHPMQLRNGEMTTRNLQEREKFYFLLDW